MISEKCCILEKSRKNLVKFGENSAKFWQILRIFGKKTAKISAIFNENFEIRERCKGVHCVDLGESFPTSIYLQNLASIQPRTSLVKFARSPRTDPPGLSVLTMKRRGRSASVEDRSPAWLRPRAHEAQPRWPRHRP